MRLALFVVGAGIGAPLRYVIDKTIRAKTHSAMGILLVNVIGSFILGMTQTNYLVMGFCGAFTTWSAFALDVVNQKRQSAFIRWIMERRKHLQHERRYNELLLEIKLTSEKLDKLIDMKVDMERERGIYNEYE